MFQAVPYLNILWLFIAFQLHLNVEAPNLSSPEVYGFHKNASGQLIVTTTNAGEDSISHSIIYKFWRLL